MSYKQGRGAVPTIIPTCPNTGPAFRGQNQDRRLKWSSLPKNNKTELQAEPWRRPDLKTTRLSLKPAQTWPGLASAELGGERAVHGAFHKLAGTLELLDEAVDILDGGAAAVRNTLASAAIDNLHVVTLVRCH